MEEDKRTTQRRRVRGNALPRAGSVLDLRWWGEIIPDSNHNPTDSVVSVYGTFVWSLRLRESAKCSVLSKLVRTMLCGSSPSALAILRLCH